MSSHTWTWGAQDSRQSQVSATSRDPHRDEAPRVSEVGRPLRPSLACPPVQPAVRLPLGSPSTLLLRGLEDSACLLVTSWLCVSVDPLGIVCAPRPRALNQG